MIEAPSLIPSQRLVRRKKRLRVRGWAGVIVLTGLLGGAGSAAARTWAVNPDTATPLSLIEAEQRLSDREAKLGSLRAEAASVASTLHAVSAASDHADWSILLAFIARLCGDDISLGSLILERAPGSDGFDLNIDGEGGSQRDIASFILGLENSGVFASTKLDGSGGGEAGSGIPFSVTCLIRPGGRPGPRAGGDG